MPGATASVIIAAAQSVAKVFVIGFIGYMSVMYPQRAPFMPKGIVGSLASFTFHCFTVPLVYSTIAIAVTVDTIGDYWFVLVGAFVGMGVSYIAATVMRCFITIGSERDFQALRVCATYPNIMALPILIFPSLCEFSVVHEGFIPHDKDDPITSSPEYLESQCVAQSNTMIFIYFFSWSLCLWSFGVHSLMSIANLPKEDENATPDTTQNDGSVIAAASQSIEGSQGKDSTSTTQNDVEVPTDGWDTDDKKELSDDKPATVTKVDTLEDGEEKPISGSEGDSGEEMQEGASPGVPSAMASFLSAVKQTCCSPGFVAMVLAFITACIPPLQKALFEGGGPVRFFGSAMETLGEASSPLSTMVAAASLVPPKFTKDDPKGSENSPSSDENPIMSDPTVGPYRGRRDSKFAKMRESLRSGSIRVLEAMPRPSREMMRLHIWYCLSRLIISPIVTIALIVGLDCGGGLLSDVPPLAKFVIIVNSSLPGAQTIIVLLKATENMEDTAAAVAKVYLPSYMLSIITIAAWTSVGLWVTLPDDDGNTLCYS